MARKHIFTAGPAVLPEAVLERLAEAVRNYQGQGQSVLELSHRSKTYEAIHNHASARLRTLLGLDPEDRILYMQGGASTQFTLVPMNLRQSGSADYILTGSWSEKALEEAQRIGQARDAGSTADAGFASLPSQLDLDPEARYVHYTSNNTIFGTQWQGLPETTQPLVCDASSDILSRPIELARHDLIYAGAQKNAGPAGVTLVIIRAGCYERLVAERDKSIPAMFDYVTQAEKDSLYNTPPTFAITAVAYVCDWLVEQGGLSAMAERNERKASKLYAAIDGSEFYAGVAAPEARSRMNVTFRTSDPEHEPAFLREAESHGFIGLKGHRSVGGLRASIYNALPEASVDALVSFMADFAQRHG